MRLAEAAASRFHREPEMKVAVVYNRESQKVINLFGTPNREKYGKQAIARIVNALKAARHQVDAFEGDKDLVDKLEEFMPRVVKGERPGLVFNLSYGIQGQARYTHVPGILEMVGIPYVGSGPMAHSLSLDKVVTKMILQQHGLPTPDFAVLMSPDDPTPELEFPLIVKPRSESVSFGLKVVHNAEELREGAQVIFDKFQQPVLVERYIEGREVNVGVLGNSPPEALPPAELDFGEGPKIYTEEDKKQVSGRQVKVVCPAKLTEEETARVQDLAVRAFKALGLVDCCRVDLRMDADGNFYILETNSLPSLGEHGSYVAAAEAVGLDFPALVNRLVEVASARYFGTPTPPGLDEQERDPKKQVFAYLTGRRDQIERRIRDWTSLSSRTSDPIGLKAAGDRMAKMLADVGLQRADQRGGESAAALWETPAGLEGGTIIVGNLDVPLPLGATTPVFRRDPEWLYGEGVGSSRAPLTMLEFALRALRRVRRLRSLRLGVLYYTDEGQDCVTSAPLMANAFAKASRVLVLRPGGTGDHVLTQRRGLRRYELRVESSPRRVGAATKKPDALRWLWNRLEQCCELSSRKNRLAVSVGDLDTTSYRLLLPHDIRAVLLVSYLDSARADAAEAEIRAILGPSRDGYRWHLHLASDRPPMLRRPANEPLIAQMRAMADEWEIPFVEDSALLPSVAGLVPEDVGVVCGIGPAATETFTSEEAVQRISVVQRTLLLAQLLLAIAEQEPKGPRRVAKTRRMG